MIKRNMILCLSVTLSACSLLCGIPYGGGDVFLRPELSEHKPVFGGKHFAKRKFDQVPSGHYGYSFTNYFSDVPAMNRYDWIPAYINGFKVYVPSHPANVSAEYGNIYLTDGIYLEKLDRHNRPLHVKKRGLFLHIESPVGTYRFGQYDVEALSFVRSFFEPFSTHAD